MSLRPRSETQHVFGNGSGSTIPVVGALTNPNRTVGVYEMLITASAPTNVTIQDSSGAALSEVMPLGGNKALILDQLNDTDPWFVTAVGLGVQLAQSGSANVGFDCWYLGGPFYTPPPTGHVAVLTPSTWNPADSSNVSLTNSNLTATDTTTFGGVRATNGFTSGKYYWECTIGTWASTSYSFVGFSTANIALTSQTIGAAGAGSLYVTMTAGGVVRNGTAAGVSIGAITTGTVVGFAVDLGNKLAWARLSPAGQWNGSGTANPATGVGGIDITAVLISALFPMILPAAVGDGGTANFGGSAFSGTVPSGFTAGWGVVA